MNRLIPFLCISFIATTICTNAVVAKTRAPDWALPYLNKHSDPFLEDSWYMQAVLFKQAYIEFKEDGSYDTRFRRILYFNKENAIKFARKEFSYFPETDTVKSMRAWVIAPNGKVTRTRMGQLEDNALRRSSIERLHAAKLKFYPEGEIHEGSILIMEATLESTPGRPQIGFQLSEDIPVVQASIKLKLPNGWKATSRTFNHEEINPWVLDNHWKWELKGIPRVQKESNTPGNYSLWKWLDILVQPSGSKAPACFQYSSTWPELASTLTRHYDKKLRLDQEVKDTVRKICAGHTSVLDKIQALSEFVAQVKTFPDIRHTGRWTGYQTNSAMESLEAGYGDSKSKTLLLAALLEEAGIDCCPVAVAADNPFAFQPDWVSPSQFTHMILAVKHHPDFSGLSSFDVPALGKAIFVDPGSVHPAGHIRRNHFGRYALPFSYTADLFKIRPCDPKRENFIRASVKATLYPNGHLQASISTNARGYWVTEQKKTFVDKTLDEAIEGYIRRRFYPSVPNVLIDEITHIEQTPTSAEQLHFRMTKLRYAESIAGTLLIYKPAHRPLNLELLNLKEKRKNPYFLRPAHCAEVVRTRIPEGMVVDEMPDPIEVKSPLGEYSSTFRVEDGILIHERSLTTKFVLIPADNYSELVAFADQVIKGENQAVVLAVD
jgi:hypothetical protein